VATDSTLTSAPTSLPPVADQALNLRPSCITLLGCRVDRVTKSDAVEWAKFFLKGGGAHQVVTANPLMLLAAAKDKDLKSILDNAALVVPESSGVFWACEQVGTPLDEFVPGIDLFQEYCRLACALQKSVFLLGAQPGVAEKAAVTLASRFPGLRIAGTHHGYFRRPEDHVSVIAQIREAAPDFLFVALNVPGQEKWIQRHRTALQVPVIMGVGGSFDVLSGKLRRAPAWMRDLGMEWLYRLIQEPWRWKRMIHLPVFVWKILTA
jgi:N-acetylglucosaminyldiphosphoundecaprenol N-acetyl-beta-D-mannosaminyltransferase